MARISLSKSSALLVVAASFLPTLVHAQSQNTKPSVATQRTSTVRADSTGAVIPNYSQTMVSPADLAVPSNLPFAKQVERHTQVLDKLANVAQQAQANLDAARAAKNFDNYVAAEEDLTNLRKALVPYAVAQAKADALIAQGYKLNDMSGKVCRGSTCSPIDSIAAIFFLRDKKGVGPKLSETAKKNDDKMPPCPEGRNCNICVEGVNLCTVYDLLADKPIDTLTFGLLPAIRDSIIPPDNKGEIAKFIRDPGKTTLQGVQKLRDQWVPPRDNGEIAKIVRDPIKCTVGHLWGGCR